MGGRLVSQRRQSPGFIGGPDARKTTAVRACWCSGPQWAVLVLGVKNPGGSRAPMKFTQADSSVRRAGLGT